MEGSEVMAEDSPDAFIGPSSLFNNISVLNQRITNLSQFETLPRLDPRDVGYFVPLMNQLVASNHDRIEPSRLTEATEIPEEEVEKEFRLAEIECKIEEAKMRKTCDQIYPDGPQSLFLCHKFELISRLELQKFNCL